MRRWRRCTRGAGPAAAAPSSRRRCVIARTERLVGAVLAPRLGERLQFDVGGIASLLAEVRLDRPQLLGVERQRPGDARARPRAASSRSRMAITSAAAPWRCRSGSSGGSAVPSCQCSMIGLATSRAMTLCGDGGIGTLDELDTAARRAATSGTPSTSPGRMQRAGRHVGDAGVEGDLECRTGGVRASPSCRTGAADRRGTRRAGRGATRRGRRRRGSGRRSTPPGRDLETELFGALLDGGRPGVGVGTSDRQAVVGGPHPDHRRGRSDERLMANEMYGAGPSHLRSTRWPSTCVTSSPTCWNTRPRSSTSGPGRWCSADRRCTPAAAGRSATPPSSRPPLGVAGGHRHRTRSTARGGTCSPTPPPSPAGTVTVRVDGERRSLVAQLHTDSHLLNAFVFERFPGTLVTGAQINADGTGRMDFDLSADRQRRAARRSIRRSTTSIRRDVAVTSVYVDADEAATNAGLVRSLSVAPPPTPDGQLRVIDIDGIDRQACGGTHLAHTGQSAPVPHHQGREQGQAQPPHPLPARPRRVMTRLVLIRHGESNTTVVSGDRRTAHVHRVCPTLGRHAVRAAPRPAGRDRRDRPPMCSTPAPTRGRSRRLRSSLPPSAGWLSSRNRASASTTRAPTSTA